MALRRWTESTAPVGTYSATLKYVARGTEEIRLGESGRFTMDCRVPAPGALDGDNDADGYDLIIVNTIGTPAMGPDGPRDLNRNGTIEALDAQRSKASSHGSGSTGGRQTPGRRGTG